MTLNDFVFLDSTNRPWRVTLTDGQIWLYKLTGNKNWITLMKISKSDRDERFKKRVDDEDAHLYTYGVPFRK